MLRPLKCLIPHLWPADRLDLRVRVLVAFVLLIVAKAINVAVPLFYKEAVDVLTGETAEVLYVPVFLIVGYGLVRALARVFGELRDVVFARVEQRARRRAGLKAFEHLHRLSLRFHLDRKTGGVGRAVERGTEGIEFLLNVMLFNIIPTLVEILLVCGMLWRLHGPGFALAVFATLGGYIAWTLVVTEWRTKFRRRMNESDSDANAKAVDSLLNYETVKYSLST